MDIFLTQALINKISGVSKSKISTLVAEYTGVQGDQKVRKKLYPLSLAREIIYNNSEYKNINIKKKIHLFYNFKGGTGKTSISYNVACGLVMLGFKVLLIDLDPQGHLTSMFKDGERLKTMYDVLIQGKNIKEVRSNIMDGLDIIPSNLTMTKIETPLMQKNKREELLARAINEIKDEYDYVIIDSNPAISNVNVNALYYADLITIVTETQPLSLSGLQILTDELENIFRELHKKLSYKILANKYDIKTATAQEIMGILRMDYKDFLYNTVIRKAEDINISTKLRNPVLSFAKPTSAAFEDILEFTKEFIEESRK